MSETKEKVCEELTELEIPDPADCYGLFVFVVQGIHKDKLFYIDGDELDAERKGYVVVYPINKYGFPDIKRGYHIIKAKYLRIIKQ